MAQTGRKLRNKAFIARGRVAVGVESRLATDELGARYRQVATALNNQMKPDGDPKALCSQPDSRDGPVLYDSNSKSLPIRFFVHFRFPYSCLAARNTGLSLSAFDQSAKNCWYAARLFA
jgi:hypothetical protein